nr:MAG TPA: hypothetical protein [Caudoviricetes sp.]
MINLSYCSIKCINISLVSSIEIHLVVRQCFYKIVVEVYNIRLHIMYLFSCKTIEIILLTFLQES